MNFKLINFILIVIYFTNVSSLTNDEYFDNSFLKSLKEKNAQLIIESNQTTIVDNLFSKYSNYTVFENKYSEIYNYKNGIGNLTSSFKIGKENYFNYKLYSTKYGKEIYSFDNSFDKAYCYYLKNEISRFLIYNVSKLIPEDRNYNFVGPIILLEELIINYNKDKNSVQCSDIENQNKKCEIIIGDKAKLEFILESKNEQTLYPNKIIIYYKKEKSNEFIKNMIINFTKIDIKYNVEETIEFKLPIGQSCQRPGELNKNYPQLQTNYGSKFKIENEIKFDYLDVTDRNFSAYKIKKDYLTRTYTNKMYANVDNAELTADTIDEYTNQSIKLIYKTDTNTVHKVNLEDNKCLTYDLDKNRSVNYFYILDLFVNEPNLFNTYNNYTFLGDYRLDNKDYFVFEKLISKRLSFGKGKSYEEYKKTILKKSVDEGNEPFKNKNRIYSTYIVVTHYYLKSDYLSKNEKIIPPKIKIQLLSSFGIRFANMTIDLKSFESNLDGYESFDTSKCSKLS